MAKRDVSRYKKAMRAVWLVFYEAMLNDDPANDEWWIDTLRLFDAVQEPFRGTEAEKLALDFAVACIHEVARQTKKDGAV